MWLLPQIHFQMKGLLKSPSSGITAGTSHYEEMQVAKAWGIVPAAWYARTSDERAWMMAFERIQGQVEYTRAQSYE